MATAAANQRNPHNRPISGATIRSVAFLISLTALLIGLSMYDYRIALVTGGVIGVALTLFGEWHASKPNPEP